MMATNPLPKPTNNPIPSTDIRDHVFAGAKLDEAMTSSNVTFVDRKGVTKKTWVGIEHFADDAISRFGYITIDSFEEGATINLPNEVLRWTASGEYYRWDGFFGDEGKIVPVNSTPESAGGIGLGKWLSVGDASLRTNLANDTDEYLGDKLIGVTQPFSGAIKRTQHEKNKDLLSVGDFDSVDSAINASIINGTSLLNNDTAFLLTVGSGGMVASLLDAIKFAFKLRPTWKSGNDYCEIRLKSGYVLSEQLVFKGGVDFSWIKITSEDPIVYSNTSGFGLTVKTYYEYKYLFYFFGHVKSPVFAIQIEENRANSDVCAFVVTEKAQLLFAPYSGARKFYVGVHATYGAEVIGLHNGGSPGSPDDLPNGYYVCDFSYSLKSALEAMSHVMVHLPLSLFEYNQNSTASPAVFCIYGTTANFFGSSASHSNYTGWVVRDGCTVTLRYHKTIQCANIGLHCIHGVFVDARNDNTGETDATTSGMVKDVNASLGFNGCYWGVRCESASIVEAAGNDFRNCSIALQLATAASLSAKACDFSNCTLIVQALAGVNVSLPRLYAQSVGKFCELQYGSKLTVWNLNISRNTTSAETRFIDARHNSVVSIYNSIKLDSAIGLVATDGSRLSISNGNIKVPAVRSFEGSQVSLSNLTYDVTYRTDAVKQLIVSAGSTITAVTCTNSDSSTPTVSITKNTLSVAGIIFTN